MKVLVIIPAYNEQENIENVVNNLQKNVEKMDYLIIDDFSNDRTVDLCTQRGYSYVSLPINLGIGGGYSDRIQVCFKVWV